MILKLTSVVDFILKKLYLFSLRVVFNEPFVPYAGMLLLCGGLVNGPYALITTAVSADLVRTESSWRASGCRLKRILSIYMLHQQGTHESLRGNSRALSTVTAIIDGTGSIGVYGTSEIDLFCFHNSQKNHSAKKNTDMPNCSCTKNGQSVVYIISNRGRCSSLRVRKKIDLSYLFLFCPRTKGINLFDV